MQISKQGLDLIVRFEGFREDAYRDPGPSGLPITIGYGSTAHGDGSPIKLGEKITRAQAKEYLRRDCAKFEAAINRKVTGPLNQNRFDALVSLVYNIGSGAFGKSSLRKKFNAGDIQGSADAFLLYTKAQGVELEGLVKRRKAERELFLSAEIAATPAPAKELDKAKTLKAFAILYAQPLSAATVKLLNGLRRCEEFKDLK